jgi:hypothetical protein
VATHPTSPSTSIISLTSTNDDNDNDISDLFNVGNKSSNVTNPNSATSPDSDLPHLNDSRSSTPSNANMNGNMQPKSPFANQPTTPNYSPKSASTFTSNQFGDFLDTLGYNFAANSSKDTSSTESPASEQQESSKTSLFPSTNGTRNSINAPLQQPHKSFNNLKQSSSLFSQDKSSNSTSSTNNLLNNNKYSISSRQYQPTSSSDFSFVNPSVHSQYSRNGEHHRSTSSPHEHSKLSSINKGMYFLGKIFLKKKFSRVFLSFFKII